ncbi:hypothetical protein HD806DRAFT_487654 [Xylariaceae sp. AK1471]|nr:hypothetical protein HD806DRAFT_487654 [Xylariaceae sp. AK1471]
MTTQHGQPGPSIATSNSQTKTQNNQYQARITVSGANPKGTGYGAGTYHKHVLKDSLPLRRIPPNRQAEQMHEAYFKLLSVLLPSYAGGPFINDTQSLIMMVLSHSPLLEKAAEILTSGSVEEMARYFNLCRGVMDFVLALESHPGLATLVYHNRHIYHEIGGDLYSLSFRDAPSKLRLEVKDTGKSFVNMLGSLAVQAESIRKHSVAVGDLATGEGGWVISEAANLLFLCDNIIQIVDLHNRNKETY